MRASISHCSIAIMKPRWVGLARPPALQEQFAHLKVLCPRRLLPFLPHWLHSDFLSHRMPLTVSPQHLADSCNFPIFLLVVCLAWSFRWQLGHGLAWALRMSIIAHTITGGFLLPPLSTPLWKTSCKCLREDASMLKDPNELYHETQQTEVCVIKSTEEKNENIDFPLNAGTMWFKPQP